MRQSLILLVVLGALLLMPREHTHQAGYAAGTPPSPTSTPVAPVPTVPPVVFIGDSVTMGAFVSTPENMFVVRVQRDLRARGLEATNDTEWTLDPYSDPSPRGRPLLRIASSSSSSSACTGQRSTQLSFARCTAR